MMYRDNCALAVIVDGQVLKEDKDGVAVMPFETEYQLRLKNKSRKKAVADVYIDSRIAAKGIVVPENGTVDLERFVTENNLCHGNRFKLVKADDGRVAQPNESENGVVHVNFYFEKDKPKVEEHHVYYDHYTHHRHVHCIHNLCPGWCISCGHGSSGDRVLYGTNIKSASFGVASSGGNQNMVALNSSQVTLTGGASSQSLHVSSENAEAAATVEGSLSHQSFTQTWIDVDYDKCTTLQIKLKGVKSIAISCNCGFKRKDETFCPHCGTKLVAA